MSTVTKQESRGASSSEALKVAAPIVQAIFAGVVATVVGYLLTGKITATIQKRQLELSAIKEMRELVHNLYADTLDTKAAQASVRMLAAYGASAIGPLVLLLQSGDPIQHAAAENGLRAVAIRDSPAVCQQMLAVVRNRTQLYSWRTHIVALRLLGQLQCVAARPAIEDYARLVRAPDLLEGQKRLASLVHPDDLLVEENVQQVWDQIDRTLSRLGGKAHVPH